MKIERKTPNEYKKRETNERKTQWTQKQLNGEFITQTIGKASEDRWGWLKKSVDGLKRWGWLTNINRSLNNGRIGTGYKNQ